MKESDLRSWHRKLGILLAAFIILQAGSGLLLSLGRLSVSSVDATEKYHSQKDTHEEGESVLHEVLEFVHEGAGTAGGIYRVLLGAGLLAMAISGSLIFLRTRTRQG